MERNFVKLALEQDGHLTPLLIDSKESGSTGLTNPSIFWNGKRMLINIRNVEYALYHSEYSQQFQNQWGCLAYLNPEDDISLRTNNFFSDTNIEYEKIDTSKLDVKPIWEFIGLEDARIVVWQGKTYLCGVRRDTTPNGVGRMELSEIQNGKEINRYRIEPPNGYTYCEKNWMPIIDMPFHFIKWTNPTEIVKVNIENGTSEQISITDQEIEFPRDVRGGSQVIPWRNGHLAITHEVDLWKNEKSNKDAQYYHRFIYWDENWQITAYSDAFKFMDAQIEFCCGLALVEHDIIISFGYQDNSAYYLAVPEQVIYNFIHEVEMTPKTTSGETDLVKFAFETTNPVFNFELGLAYFNLGHYASSLTFFLRSAELFQLTKTNVDKTLCYSALIMVAVSLGKMGRRRASEKTALLTAIAYHPKRFEGYYILSQWYEAEKDYANSYTMACLAFERYEFDTMELLPILEIKKYKIQFQIAFASWWVGQFEYSRKLFLQLAENHAVEMDVNYKELVRNNITRLCSGDKFLAFSKPLHEKLAFKFPNSESIEKNYSQTLQDMFVLFMTKGKKSGTYLEIGSADPEYGSNTKLLESQFNWNGVGIEILEQEVKKHEVSRRNTVYLKDALEVDYDKLLTEMSIQYGNGFDFDYLQVDCEPPSVSFEILKMIPFDKFRFAVVTFEHDYYADLSKQIREKSREFMKSKGYVLTIGNVSMNDDCPYEDWYVHPELVDMKNFTIIEEPNKPVVNVGKYFYES
jgi:hypothetical protein